MPKLPGLPGLPKLPGCGAPARLAGPEEEDSMMLRAEAALAGPLLASAAVPRLKAPRSFAGRRGWTAAGPAPSGGFAAASNLAGASSSDLSKDIAAAQEACNRMPNVAVRPARKAPIFARVARKQPTCEAAFGQIESS